MKNPCEPQAAQKGPDARRRGSEERGVLRCTLQRRATKPTPQMGLFQQPAKAPGGPGGGAGGGAPWGAPPAPGPREDRTASRSPRRSRRRSRCTSNAGATREPDQGGGDQMEGDNDLGGPARRRGPGDPGNRGRGLILDD